jgi:hypothetical protein
MSQFITTLPYNNVLHFYLWISHGTNVSSNHNYYPLETKFSALTFYSRPFETISSEFLQMLDSVIINSTNNQQGSPIICSLISGACPHIPVTDKKTKKKNVYLPPLIFGVFPDDADDIKKYSGLYYFTLIKTNKENCKILKNEQILDHNKLLQFGNITYSLIFKFVLENCKTKNLNPNDVMLGIYSCQSKNDKYIQEYNQSDINNFIPKYADISLETANILTNMSQFADNGYSSLCIIPYKTLKPWNALGGIKTQGCGLNVLSYYDIIDQTSAREETTCLNIKGTSIFRIIDYIYDYNFWASASKYSDDKYFVLRMEIETGLHLIIVDFMNKYKINNYAIIFKVYKEEKIFNKEFSEVGHSVSIAYNQGNIIYIDPQGELNAILQGTPEEMANQLYSEFLNKTQFRYMDVIFTYYDNKEKFGPEIPTFDKKYIMERIDKKIVYFRPKPFDVNYGGNNKNKKRLVNNNKKKTRVNNKKKTKINKTKKNKTKNKRKNKKGQYGGYDAFEEAMLDADKKNGIPSVLVVESIS